MIVPRKCFFFILFFFCLIVIVSDCDFDSCGLEEFTRTKDQSEINEIGLSDNLQIYAICNKADWTAKNNFKSFVLFYYFYFILFYFFFDVAW